MFAYCRHFFLSVSFSLHATDPADASSSASIIRDDAKYILGTYARKQVVLTEGKGCKLYDCEGKEFLGMQAFPFRFIHTRQFESQYCNSKRGTIQRCARRSFFLHIDFIAFLPSSDIFSFFFLLLLLELIH